MKKLLILILVITIFNVTDLALGQMTQSVQVIGTLGASTAIAIHGENYSPRLRSSQGSNMKNRLSQYDLSEDDREDYEIWADALFEVAFNQPNDVGTLVFGPSRENGLEDFSLTQTKAQQKRLQDNFKDRRG